MVGGTAPLQRPRLPSQRSQLGRPSHRVPPPCGLGSVRRGPVVLRWRAGTVRARWAMERERERRKRHPQIAIQHSPGLASHATGGGGGWRRQPRAEGKHKNRDPPALYNHKACCCTASQQHRPLGASSRAAGTKLDGPPCAALVPAADAEPIMSDAHERCRPTHTHPTVLFS